MKKIGFLILTSLCLASCGGHKKEVQVFERPVKLYKVELMNYTTKTFTGIVKSDQISNLAFKMGGQLIKLQVDNGQKVSQGQFIAEIDPIDFKLQLDAAKAAYTNSKSQLDRYERLITRQAISQQQYEIAQANYARDKSSYENAKKMLDETKIYAPFAGVIEKRYVDNYQRVQATEPVVRLVNLNKLEVDFTLPDVSLSLMNAQDKQFIVIFESYPETQFKAKVVKFVDSSPGGSGLPVTVAIDDPTFAKVENNIKPGFSATVILRVPNKSLENMTVVPITAIDSDLATGADRVWVYDPQTSTVNLKPVTLGDLSGKDMVVVTKGLSQGEEIVTAGIYMLTQGQKVKVLK